MIALSPAEEGRVFCYLSVWVFILCLCGIKFLDVCTVLCKWTRVCDLFPYWGPVGRSLCAEFRTSHLQF